MQRPIQKGASLYKSHWCSEIRCRWIRRIGFGLSGAVYRRSTKSSSTIGNQADAVE